jgi:hypothetical protein
MLSNLLGNYFTTNFWVIIINLWRNYYITNNFLFFIFYFKYKDEYVYCVFIRNHTQNCFLKIAFPLSLLNNDTKVLSQQNRKSLIVKQKHKIKHKLFSSVIPRLSNDQNRKSSFLRSFTTESQNHHISFLQS